MKAKKQISCLMFLLLWTVARCFPPVPLNERTTEKLTYEAYLLIEESLNQQKDSTVERRIKEKSIFIAPIISPESSPGCGNDRCKKLMPKKEIPLENLLQLLNQEYSFMEENEEDITTGPLYINIPLKAVEEETEFAMMITPTKNAVTDMDHKTTPNEEKVEFSDIAEMLGMKKGSTETTSATETTVQESSTETTVVNTQDSTSETNASFFTDSKREGDVKTDTTTAFSTSSRTETTENLPGESTTPRLSFQESELNLYQMDQALPYVDSSISFVDVKREIEKAKVNSVSEKTTEKPHTAFTVRSTLMVTKKEPLPQYPIPKVSSPSPFKMAVHEDSTTSSMLFTPINNILSIDDGSKAPSEGSTSRFESLQAFTKTKLDENNGFYQNIGSATNDLSPNGPFQSTTEATTTTESGKILFPTVSSASTTVRKFMVRFPTSPLHVRFPTSSSSSSSPTAIPTYSSDIFDRFGATRTRTTDSADDRGDTIKSLPDVNLTYAIPIHVNLTSLYERIKAQRENHRNREKHSEWFHLPTKWWDTSHPPPVLRISRKNGHMDVQEVNPDNFFRHFNGRSFEIKSAIQR